MVGVIAIFSFFSRRHFKESTESLCSILILGFFLFQSLFFMKNPVMFGVYLMRTFHFDPYIKFSFISRVSWVLFFVVVPLGISAYLTIKGQDYRQIIQPGLKTLIKLFILWIVLVVLVPIAVETATFNIPSSPSPEFNDSKILELSKNYIPPDPRDAKKLLEEHNSAALMIGTDYLNETQIQEIIMRFNTSGFDVSRTGDYIIVKPVKQEAGQR
ncbi:MAG: hypothetical protein D6733_04665 [Methanobacteriota archaeon]|nr:MAG: hypothetical protein D6733_04665 [Euryarchaeota archaeon]